TARAPFASWQVLGTDLLQDGRSVRLLCLGQSRLRPPDRIAPPLRDELRTAGAGWFRRSSSRPALDQSPAPQLDANRSDRWPLAPPRYDDHGAELQYLQRRRRSRALRLLPHAQARVLGGRAPVRALVVAEQRVLFAGRSERPRRARRWYRALDADLN